MISELLTKPISKLNQKQYLEEVKKLNGIRKYNVTLMLNTIDGDEYDVKIKLDYIPSVGETFVMQGSNDTPIDQEDKEGFEKLGIGVFNGEIKEIHTQYNFDGELVMIWIFVTADRLIIKGES